MLQIIQTDTPAPVVRDAFVSLVDSYPETPILVLLAGGSWLPLYAQFPESLYRKGLTFMMGDERYSEDLAVNNCAQLKTTEFYHAALRGGATVLDTTVRAGESFPAFHERFSSYLADWQRAHETGVVIALLGMGEDGHTAGIFANSDAAAWQTGAATSAYEVSAAVSPHKKRVSVTSRFLATIVTEALVYVSGVHKCACLQTVLRKPAYTATLPATLWQVLPKVTLVTDCEIE